MAAFVEVPIAFNKNDFERLPNGMTRVNCGYTTPLTLEYVLKGDKLEVGYTWDEKAFDNVVAVLSLLLEEVGYPKEITYEHDHNFTEEEVLEIDKNRSRRRLWAHINVPYCCIEEGVHGRAWIKKKIIP